MPRKKTFKERTTVWLDKETWRRARFLALERGTSASALVEQGLQELLTRAERKSKGGRK
jgi:hypothetical protein